MARMEDKITRMNAKVQSKVRTQYVDVVKPGSLTSSGSDEVVHIRSSWVRSFAYDNRTKTLYMTIHSGKTYQWDNIDQMTAWNCIRGNASCTTADRRKRWWVGKNPSLGAAYWTYLRSIAHPKLAGPASAPSGASYFDIATEGYVPKYNMDIHRKGKKGRPTKAERKARDFAWSGRYA